MTPEFAVDILKQMIYQAVLLAAPLLLIGMIIGLGISLFQAVTTIHEQTLSFVPKALGVIALMLITLPWMVRTLTEFTITVIEKIPQMAQ
jgi:flagellar biosynthetic protein FliQ